jgi:hypothetical protein
MILIQDYMQTGEEIADKYLLAKQEVIRYGYSEEIDWQDNFCFDNVSESYFLEQLAWVILSTGMNEKIIRNKFSEISDVFYNWKNSDIILNTPNSVRKHALKIFNNKLKIDAILSGTRKVSVQGIENIKNNIRKFGPSSLMEFDYIGPVTSNHLAKNLGLNVTKADRHLLNICLATRRVTPDDLCKEIASIIDEKISVIDIVLWRYATLNKNYITFFANDV